MASKRPMEKSKGASAESADQPSTSPLSSSGGGEAHAYELFQLVRLLSLRVSRTSNTPTSSAPSTPIASSSSQSAVHSPPSLTSSTSSSIEEDFQMLGDSSASVLRRSAPGSNVTITGVAVGGYKNHEFIAMACSNDYLIFRYVGESGLPIVRQMPWFKEPNKRIVAMDFNPTAQWLMCVTADSTVILIPIYFLMCKRSAALSSENEENITATSAPVKPNTTLKSSSSGGLLSKFKAKSTKEEPTPKGKQRAATVSSNKPPTSDAVSPTKSWVAQFPSLLDYAQRGSNSSGSATRKPFLTLGSLNDITVITASTKPKPVGITKCLWWRTSDGRDYGIVASQKGTLVFINFHTQEEQLALMLKHPVASMDLVDDPVNAYKYLLLHTPVGYWRLLLEQRVSHGNPGTTTPSALGTGSAAGTTWQSVLQFAGKPPFVAMHLTSLANVALSVHRLPPPLPGASPNTLVGAYHPATHKLEAYGPDLGRFADFVYQLFPGTSMVHITDKLIFTVNDPASGGLTHSGSPAADPSSIGTHRLVVISKLMAGTSANPHFFSKHQRQSIMQEFRLPQGQRVRGIFPAFVPPPSRAGGNAAIGGGADDDNGDTTSSAADDTSSDGPHDGPDGTGSGDVAMPGTTLAGLYVWTDDTLYEVRQGPHTPEAMFLRLLAEGREKSDAEPLGKSLGLDVLSLYEAAADRHFDAGQYGRALDLYYLSNVRTTKLIHKFLAIDRIDIVMTHLRGALHTPEALPAGERKRLSDIMFRCYVERCLYSNAVSAASPSGDSSGTGSTAASSSSSNDTSEVDFRATLEGEFLQYVKKNKDYSEAKALSLLLRHGLLYYFVRVAHARGIVPSALGMLVHHGGRHLDRRALEFLRKKDYHDELKTCGGGSLFRTLPPADQVRLLLHDPSTLPRYFRRLGPLLSRLDDITLAELCTCLDPAGQFAKSIPLQYDPPAANSSADGDTALDDAAAGPEEAVELFLLAVLELSTRARLSGHVPVQPPAAAAATAPVVSTHASSPATSEAVDKVSTGRAGVGPSSGPSGSAGLLTDSKVAMFNSRRVVKVACGWNHVAAVTEAGELFAWGSNRAGQLGTGDLIDGTLPRRVPITHGGGTAAVGRRVRVADVAAGGYHTIAIAADTRDLWGWGGNEYGQLGQGEQVPAVAKQTAPALLVLPAEISRRITQVECGYTHTALLTEEGSLWVCGSGEQGQLGLADRYGRAVPARVPTLDDVIQVACGYCHTAALTESGQVFTFGAGLYGQLGHGDTKDSLVPRLVEALQGSHIRKIACGSMHTVAVTELDSVYIWGYHGNAGSGGSVGSYSAQDFVEHAVPRLVDGLLETHVAHVACGHWHTVALSKKGNLYVWGSGRYGQLGHGSTADVPVPRIVHSLKNKGLRIVSVTCGEDFTVALTDAGEVYTWGSGEAGQLGVGDVDGRAQPTRIDALAAFDGTAPPAAAAGQSGAATAATPQPIANVPAPSPNTARRQSTPSTSPGLYTAEHLEVLLKTHFRGYRPVLMLRRCTDAGAWSAAAVIHELLGEFEQCVECGLRNISSLSTSKSAEQDRVLKMLDDVISKARDERQRAELLLLVLRHWRDRELDHSAGGKLESHIFARLEVFAGPLVILLERFATAERPFCVEFSPLCYIRLAEYGLSKMKRGHKVSTALGPSTAVVGSVDTPTGVPEERLWTNIKENLEHDLTKRDKVIVPITTAQALVESQTPTSAPAAVRNVGPVLASINSSTESEAPRTDVVAFTCGHTFTRRVFFESYLAEFKRRVADFPKDIPVTLSLMVSDYHQRAMAMACPVCVYNTLRDEQVSLSPGLDLKPWSVSVV